MNVGIPTMYAGVQFRSRLEATWAAFFDELKWPWEYEPIDLDGYIPDFILPFERAPLLVEVKPIMRIEEAREHTKKIEESGWDHEAIVVGARIMSAQYWDQAVMGLISEHPAIDRDGNSCWAWNEGAFFMCPECKGVALFDIYMNWSCHRCGRVPGAKCDYTDDDDEFIRRAWTNAKNTVQWRSPRPVR